MRAGIVGGGVIGGGWAARFLLNGWDVAVFDPDPQAERKLRAVLAAARASLPALYDRALPPEGALSFAPSLAEAVAGADWVQESVPERLEVKQAVLGQIAAAAPAGAVIGSSTSGFRPSQLQEGMAAPGAVMVAHPFVPVYLLPLVEVVPGAETAPDIVARAQELLRSVGMHPLLIRKEIDAHIADRLLEAVWRESLWLVKDGIATTAEIDDAIRYGFGLRWAQMGLFETYRIGGGEAGMAHFLHQFGPALKWPWTRLMDVPELDAGLVKTVSDQSDAQSGHLSIAELETLRDRNLVAILRGLRHSGSGAAQAILTHEAGLPQRAAEVTVQRQVPRDWADYNGHVNEARYLDLSAQASDRVMELLGADAAYVAQGRSYFTVETHLRHLGELHTGDAVTVTSRVLKGEGKALHLWHEIAGPRGLAATAETLLLHVDLATRRTVAPEGAVAQAVAAMAAAQAGPVPEGAGRFVGQRG